MVVENVVIVVTDGRLSTILIELNFDMRKLWSDRGADEQFVFISLIGEPLLLLLVLPLLWSVLLLLLLILLMLWSPFLHDTCSSGQYHAWLTIVLLGQPKVDTR